MTISQMKYYKQQKGYSLDQLSQLSGVPRGTLQKIFSGETKSPRHETLQALENVLRPEGDSYEYDTECISTYRVAEAAPNYGKKQGEYGTQSVIGDYVFDRILFSKFQKRRENPTQTKYQYLASIVTV